MEDDRAVEERNPSGRERTLAMACHLSAFAGVIIPFGNIFGPLVVWILTKDEYPLADDQGKESLNFQISVFLYSIVCGLLIFLVVGIFMLLVLALFTIIQVIKASISANNGNAYRYPFCLRFIA